MVKFLEYSGEKLVPMDNVAETGRKPVWTYGLHYLGLPSHNVEPQHLYIFLRMSIKV